MRRKYYKCKYCKWEWLSNPKNLKGKKPKVCPKCHNDWRKTKKGDFIEINIKKVKNGKR